MILYSQSDIYPGTVQQLYREYRKKKQEIKRKKKVFVLSCVLGVGDDGPRPLPPPPGPGFAQGSIPTVQHIVSLTVKPILGDLRL